jgi:hypothetical protein
MSSPDMFGRPRDAGAIHLGHPAATEFPLQLSGLLAAAAALHQLPRQSNKVEWRAGDE